jgi:hypothetical protein
MKTLCELHSTRANKNIESAEVHLKLHNPPFSNFDFTFTCAVTPCTEWVSGLKPHGVQGR